MDGDIVVDENDFSDDGNLDVTESSSDSNSDYIENDNEELSDNTSEAGNVATKVRGICSFFSHSPKAAGKQRSKLKSYNEGHCLPIPIMDCVTRRSSTLKMVKDYLEIRRNVSEFFGEINSSKNNRKNIY